MTVKSQIERDMLSSSQQKIEFMMRTVPGGAEIVRHKFIYVRR